DARQRNGKHGPERCRMQGFYEGGVNGHRIPRPIDRPHARKQIDRLLRSIVEELGDYLDALDCPEDREQHHEIENVAHGALGRREALPARARWSAAFPAHWNNRRIQPDTISPIMTTITMAITMVSTKS